MINKVGTQILDTSAGKGKHLNEMGHESTLLSERLIDNNFLSHIKKKTRILIGRCADGELTIHFEFINGRYA
jgi:hypothetical protein